MHVVLVHVHVLPGHVDAFVAATGDNAANSRLEAGVVRFDFLQQADDPTRFTLIEAYRGPADQEAHRGTAHYLRWREAVEGMMAGPRVGVRYRNVSPADGDW
jgi:quinol monooxygenase YgiN